jgi:hypothetical protein
MGVDPNSVDLRIQRPSAGLDESDLEVSRQFTYLVRCVRNVRIMNDVYGRVRKGELGRRSRICTAESVIYRLAE